MKNKLLILITFIISLSVIFTLASCDEPDITDTYVDDGTTAGSNDGTTEGDFTDMNPPENVTISVNSTTGEYLVDLDWNDVVGTESYEVYVSENGGKSYSLLANSTESAYTFDTANWGDEYSFIIKALAGGAVIGESEPHVAKTAGIRVNDFAPKDGKMVLWCKKVGQESSDGFVLYVNGEIYVIDGGHASESNLILNTLLGLRTKWLANQSDSTLANNINAKLAVNFVVSHAHSDHVNAVLGVVSNRMLSVETLYCPERSYLGTATSPGAIPLTVECENRIDTIQKNMKSAGHKSGSIVRLPFGEKMQVSFSDSDTILDLYASPIDWSITKESATEGWNLYAAGFTESTTEKNKTNAILNANCMWAKFTCNGQSALFTGDTDDSRFVLDKFVQYHGAENFDCDVLKYLHHGSFYSLYLFEVTTPTITVFTGHDHYTNTASKNATAAAMRFGDLYLLYKGSCTLTFDGTNITGEGIAPAQ